MLFSRTDWKTEESTGRLQGTPSNYYFFFFLARMRASLTSMLQQQVTVRAVTQCLTSSGSTLTIKEIQHNSSMTLRKQYMQATVLKSSSHGLLVKAAT